MRAKMTFLDSTVALTITLLVVVISISLYQAALRQNERFKTFFARHQATLLVFAHPDDETMFFYPAIKALKDMRHPAVILCLSSGDADGLGALRKLEFKKLMSSIKPSKHYMVEDNRIPDGFHSWDETVILEHVQAALAKHPEVDVIMSFDQGGVSGHPNHISISKALHHLKGQFTYLELVTVPLIAKYAAPPLDLFSTTVHNLIHVVNLSDWLGCSRLMRIYQSQYVWFRQLFALFSRYAYVNSFRVRRSRH